MDSSDIQSTVTETLRLDRADLPHTILLALGGTLLYLLVRLLPSPFFMVGILKVGLLPALSIIALFGALRGPVVGFFTGYLGELAYSLLVYGTVVTWSLDAAALGVIGLIVGMSTYDFTNGRSLLKLSVISTVGFAFTLLLLTIIALKVEVYSVLVAIGFEVLPLLTTGLPTLLFLTPVLARILYALSESFMRSGDAAAETN